MHNTNSMTMRSRSQSPHHDDSTRHKSKGDWRRKIVLKISFPRSNIVTLWISFVTLFLLPHTVQCSGFDKEGVYVIDGIWIDDFAQDSTRYAGWQIKNGNTGDLGNPFIDENPKAPIIFHGIFTKTNINEASQHNYLYRYFSCDRASMVYVSFAYAFCDHSDPEFPYHYTQVGLNLAFSQEYDMEGGLRLSTLEPDLSFVNDPILEDNIAKCYDLPQWNYQTISNYYAGSVEKRTLFLITIQSTVSSYNDFHVFFNLSIECVPMPTSQPTVEPTAAPSTPSPSNRPTSPPSNKPTATPQNAPTAAPSAPPSIAPTAPPSNAPSAAPSTPPSNAPSTPPSNAPSQPPTASPTTCLDFDSNHANDGEDVYLLSVQYVMQRLSFNAVGSGVFIATDGEYINNAVEEFANDLIQEMQCVGLVSCFLSTFTFKNNSICNIHCNNTLSCSGTSISITQCDHVHVICNGVQSCDGMDLFVESENNGSHVNIECGATTSCQNMRISIHSIAPTFTNISCIDYGACNNINIEVNDANNSRLKLYSHSA
eukprot:896753_1